MTNDQQGHPSSKANNHFTCGACSSGCGWDCAAAPEGRRNFLVSRACCTVYCNLPGCCFHLRIGAKKTHPGSMGGGEMPLRKIAASLAENPGFSCVWVLAVGGFVSWRHDEAMSSHMAGRCQGWPINQRSSLPSEAARQRPLATATT